MGCFGKVVLTFGLLISISNSVWASLNDWGRIKDLREAYENKDGKTRLEIDRRVNAYKALHTIFASNNTKWLESDLAIMADTNEWGVLRIEAATFLGDLPWTQMDKALIQKVFDKLFESATSYKDFPALQSAALDSLKNVPLKPELPQAQHIIQLLQNGDKKIQDSVYGVLSKWKDSLSLADSIRNFAKELKFEPDQRKVITALAVVNFDNDENAMMAAVHSNSNVLKEAGFLSFTKWENLSSEHFNDGIHTAYEDLKTSDNIIVKKAAAFAIAVQSKSIPRILAPLVIENILNPYRNEFELVSKYFEKIEPRSDDDTNTEMDATDNAILNAFQIVMMRIYKESPDWSKFLRALSTQGRTAYCEKLKKNTSTNVYDVYSLIVFNIPIQDTELFEKIYFPADSWNFSEPLEVALGIPNTSSSLYSFYLSTVLTAYQNPATHDLAITFVKAFDRSRKFPVSVDADLLITHYEKDPQTKELVRDLLTQISPEIREKVFAALIQKKEYTFDDVLNEQNVVHSQIKLVEAFLDQKSFSEADWDRNRSKRARIYKQISRWGETASSLFPILRQIKESSSLMDDERMKAVAALGPVISTENIFYKGSQEERDLLLADLVSASAAVDAKTVKALFWTLNLEILKIEILSQYENIYVRAGKKTGWFAPYGVYAQTKDFHEITTERIRKLLTVLTKSQKNFEPTDWKETWELAHRIKFFAEDGLQEDLPKFVEGLRKNSKDIAASDQVENFYQDLMNKLAQAAERK